MTAYVVDPLSYARASSLVLVDARPKTDIVFIHGSPAANDAIDAELLKLAVDMVRTQETEKLVINGLTDEACWPNGQRLAYPGCNTWGRTLQGLGFSEFLKIPPSKHTAAESDNLIKLAAEMGWKKLVIMSYPHHILRCMLQMVFCLKRAGSDLKVYTRTLPSVNWQMVAEKGVLGKAPFRGTLVDAHIREEYERLISYADRACFETPDGRMVSEEEAGSNDKRKYTPHATLEELIDYYKQRDDQGIPDHFPG